MKNEVGFIFVIDQERLHVFSEGVLIDPQTLVKILDVRHPLASGLLTRTGGQAARGPRRGGGNESPPLGRPSQRSPQ